jgi:RNA polymerase sigma-70 factor (ECF subfamily)
MHRPTAVHRSLALDPSSPPGGGRVEELPTAEGVSDEQLVERAQAGESWAEDALYRRHVRYVGGMVTRLFRGSDEAEDIMQETFALALHRLAQLREPARFRSWIAQIAVSLVHRRFRRQRLLHIVSLGIAGDAEDLGFGALVTPDATPRACTELVALGRELSRMPPAHQIAWMLRYVEGEALEDIARICGCSLATTKRRIAAANERLRQRGLLDGEGEPA